MKNSITFGSLAFAVLFSLNVNAQTTIKIDKGTVALQSLQAVDVKTSPLCPPNVTCITNGTIVDLKFLLPSCVDSLGPVTFKSVQTKKNIELFVSAFAQIDKQSELVKCFAPTYKTARITLVGQFGTVKVKYVDTSAATEE